MGKLRIIADAPTQGGRNQKRGKLFEALVAEVLRRHGYRIDRIPNTNYAGMEIDIEGTHLVTGQPLYAECKCYESEVDSSKFQAFFGKFMTRWRKDKRAHGLFIAIPGVNSHAKGFYNESCVNETDFSVRLLEEDAVLDALVESGTLAELSTFAKAVPAARGSAGEWDVLVTETGIAVVQRIVPSGSLVPSQITLLDAKGVPLNSRASVEKVIELEPELRSYELLILGESQPVVPSYVESDEETIVEVKGSSECFEFEVDPQNWTAGIVRIKPAKERSICPQNDVSTMPPSRRRSPWRRSRTLNRCMPSPRATRCIPPRSASGRRS